MTYIIYLSTYVSVMIDSNVIHLKHSKHICAFIIRIKTSTGACDPRFTVLHFFSTLKGKIKLKYDTEFLMEKPSILFLASSSLLK